MTKTNSKSKFLSLLLVLAMVLSVSPVFAAEGDQNVPVTLTVEEPIFSVGIPTVLPITITEEGEVLTSDAAVIVNNSAGPVMIKNIQINGIDSWETVEFGSRDMKSVDVDTKEVSMQLIFGDEETGTVVKTTGNDTNDFSGFIRIPKGESLPLPYNAEVPAQKEVHTEIQVAEVTFSFGWSE